MGEEHGSFVCLEGGACVVEHGLQGVGHVVDDQAREEMIMVGLAVWRVVLVLRNRGYFGFMILVTRLGRRCLG